MIKNKRLSFLLLFGVLSAYSQDIERRTLTTDPFYGVQVYSRLDVKLIPANVNKARTCC